MRQRLLLEEKLSAKQTDEVQPHSGIGDAASTSSVSPTGCHLLLKEKALAGWNM